MNFKIAGKTALVFGAAGGLGSAIAFALAREGVNIAAADVDQAGLNKVTEEIRQLGVSSIALTWDLSRLDEIEGGFKTVEIELGPVDILINNTGGPPPASAIDFHADVWSQYFQSMVLSIVKITDRALPSMRDRQWGRIITSTSSGVVAPIPNLAVSNALRSSLVGWSKSLSREIAPEGLTSNIVVPGRIATARIRSLDIAAGKRSGRSIDDIVSESTSVIPVGRYGRPEEYGNVVAFLASEQASYVTGSIVRVDGGYIPSI